MEQQKASIPTLNPHQEKSSQLKSIDSPPLNDTSTLDLKSLLQIQLQQYNDLQDQQFELLQDNFEQQIQVAKQYQSTYMHQHSNVIPIGTNYQATIPQLLPDQHYKIRSRETIERLFILKINDPEKLKQFIEKYQDIVKKNFQQFELTEEDYCIMYNNYKQYGKDDDVEFGKYLEKTIIYWNKYFLGKQKIVAKTMLKKKKKRNKGSIPI